MAHFFAMGGYAGYVWPAFGASFIGVGAIIWTTLRDYARAKRQLAALERDTAP
jgi:heme exporter protein D